MSGIGERRHFAWEKSQELVSGMEQVHFRLPTGRFLLRRLLFSGAVDVSVFVRIFLYDIVIEKRASKAYGSENKAAGMDWEAQLADLSSASACCTAGAGSILVRERYVV